MNRTSPLPSDEADPLNTRPSRASVEDIELRDHSHDASRLPSPPLDSMTYYSTGRESGDSATARTSIDSRQQTHLQIRHKGENLPYPKQKPQYSNHSYRPWLWEVSSIAAGAIALGAIVITLVLHRDRPIPKWPSAITINALIAVFTAIFKACVMMPIAECMGQLKWLWYQKPRPLGYMEQWDLASRGPWGSLLLIYTLKSRGLAVVGAILTIGAMAVDPFTQQILQFYSCSVVVEGEHATVPFSNNYTAGFVDPNLESQMRSAMYIGLLDPPKNVSAALDFECRTGNCTFPSTEDRATFLSLALESRCADKSNDISVTVEEHNTTDYRNETYVYTTTKASLLDYGIHLNSTNYSTNYYPWSPMRTGSKHSDQLPSSFLLTLSFLMAPESSDLQHAKAFECEFFPVVNTYSANVTNGVLLEQVLDSKRMDVWPVVFTYHTLLLVNKTIRAGEWHQCSSSRNPSDENDFPIINRHKVEGPVLGTSHSLEELTNQTFSYGDLGNFTEWWPRDCVYWIDIAPTQGLMMTLDSLLGNQSLSFDTVNKRATGDLWAVSLWRNGSATLDTVQAAMDGITRSITACWRRGDGISNNIGPTFGTVWDSQTCVGVNWRWIALPGGLLVFTIVFLVLTILKTRSMQAQAWKSSILAVLFSGLDQEARQAAGPVTALREMKAAADRATVRVEDTQEGSRLASQT